MPGNIFGGSAGFTGAGGPLSNGFASNGGSLFGGVQPPPNPPGSGPGSLFGGSTSGRGNHDNGSLFGGSSALAHKTQEDIDLEIAIKAGLAGMQ